MSWYAITTSPGSEKRASREFTDRGFEVFHPTERVWRTIGRKTAYERTLIRGYCIVETNDVPELIALVHDIAWTGRLVPANDAPEIVPGQWVEDIRTMWANGDFDQTVPRDRKTGKIKRRLDIGDDIRVTGGLYFGATGKLERIKGRRKAKVLLTWLRGQQVKTEIDFAQLEAA